MICIHFNPPSILLQTPLFHPKPTQTNSIEDELRLRCCRKKKLILIFCFAVTKQSNRQDTVALKSDALTAMDVVLNFFPFIDVSHNQKESK